MPLDPSPTVYNSQPPCIMQFICGTPIPAIVSLEDLVLPPLVLCFAQLKANLFLIGLFKSWHQWHKCTPR